MSERLTKVYTALADLKLFDIEIYDFQGRSPFFDYQIIASASNERQAHSSIEFIKNILEDKDHLHIEADKSNRWILLDLKDIIVHVMHKETRELYQIESLFHGLERVIIGEENHGI